MINETNEKIRYTSFKFFLEKGYEATNIRDICKMVDIKPSSLYFYYKSKQELFLSIYDEIWNNKIKFLERISESDYSSSSELKLKQLFKLIIKYHSNNILNEKFLLRYHLFPANEINTLIKDKYNFWSNKENNIMINLVSKCKDEIKHVVSINEFLFQYKSFLNHHLNNIVTSDIKPSLHEQDIYWMKFWDKYNLKDENFKLKEKLNENEYFYSMLFKSYRSVMLVINPDNGNIIEANDAAVNYYGYTKDRFKSMNIRDINTLSEQKIKSEMALALSEKRNYFRFKHRLADSSVRDVDVYSFPVKNETKNLLFSIVYDAHEKSEHKFIYEQLILTSPYGVVVLNKEQRIVNVNEKFEDMFQYKIKEIEGKFINNIVSPRNNKSQIDKNIEVVFKGQIVKQEGMRKCKDGKLIDVEVIAYPILYNQNVRGAYILYNDISHKQRDTLTGLYNRNYFIETIDRHIADYNETNEMFSVIVIDIEEFRDINDTLGFINGDELLKEISKRITTVSDEKYLVARTDGDEFAVLINSAIKKDLLSFSNLILKSLNQPYSISKTEIYLNFNIGISIFPKDGTISDNIIRFANAAMHQVRTNSMERINFYNSEISKKIENKFFFANYLFKAISNNELTVNYQPIFNINDKTIVGAEALLRWDNAILGEVPPDKFIPIAEKTGLIISIGEWVLKRVCEQIKLWKSKGFELIPISINISVNQLENIKFAKTVIEIIENNNIVPQLIELEITESVSSGDIPIIVNNIRELKKCGITISMDDFGTGFSSLGQLDIFELDKLKIDKIFIEDLANGLKMQNLVKSIIAMAKSLNLITVAEGIETKEQLCYLMGLGCQFGQGFIFSEPLEVEEIETLLKKKSN